MRKRQGWSASRIRYLHARPDQSSANPQHFIWAREKPSPTDMTPERKTQAATDALLAVAAIPDSLHNRPRGIPPDTVCEIVENFLSTVEGQIREEVQALCQTVGPPESR